MPHHPADRLARRIQARKHRPYDGDRHMLRTMQNAMDAMYAADREALRQEWDHAATFSPTGFYLAGRFTDMLASL